MIFLGNTTMALGIVMFVLPNELMTGGTTGLSLIIDHYLHLPISVFVFIFNCIMFLLGALILGFDFALTTLISTFYYPIALGFFQNIPSLSTITDDRMLSSIFGGLFIGFSLGIVIRCGASTGGMDIPPLILNKKFGLPVSVMLYVFDFLILIGQALFCDKEAILYGILLVMTYTIVLVKFLSSARLRRRSRSSARNPMKSMKPLRGRWIGDLRCFIQKPDIFIPDKI